MADLGEVIAGRLGKFTKQPAGPTSAPAADLVGFRSKVLSEWECGEPEDPLEPIEYLFITLFGN